MKSPVPELNAVPSPNFRFTFARDGPKELSAAAQALLAETEEEAAKVRAEMIASMPKVPESDLESAAGRKLAKPKGKAGRFSDVHMAAFKKMDSIANHPSAWRMDPNRKKPATTAVQAGFSKIEAEPPAARSLKRSPSKAELDSDSAANSLKRAPSKAELGQGPKSLPRMPSTSTLYKPTMASLKRAPSKPNLHGSRDHTPTQTPGRIPVSRPASGLPQSSPAKRVKRDMSDDASTNRPVSREGSSDDKLPIKMTQKEPGLARQKSGLLRPGFGSLMTPTKASLARAQSTNNLRGEPASSLPTLARSKSTKDLLQPQTPEHSRTPAPLAAPTPTPMKTFNFVHDSPVKPPELPTSPPPMLDQTPARVRSILRTPNRRYTRDPAKIAAGTHFSTPPSQLPILRVAPSTAPARKHVNFTASTKEVEMEDADAEERDTTKSASVEPEAGAVRYPELFSEGDGSPRRTTVSDLPMPGAFTFRSGHEVSFSSTRNSTIRPVRNSDVGSSSLSFTPKRKLGAMDTLGEDREGEESSKENRGDGVDDEDDNRPAKKARMSVVPTAATVAPTPRKSKLPTRKGVRGSGMTASRLSMLATPKRRN